MAHHYIGDINLEHGGIFIEIPDSFDQDYATVLQVTDLESAIGFDGALLIESGSIYLSDDPKYLDSALSVIGGTKHEQGTKEYWLDLVMAYNAYWGIDSPTVETVAFDHDIKESFDGWKIDNIMPNSNIAAYIASEYGIEMEGE